MFLQESVVVVVGSVGLFFPAFVVVLDDVHVMSAFGMSLHSGVVHEMSVFGMSSHSHVAVVFPLEFC